ncbi:divergent polysaccharide deacteylase family protein [Wenxinia marina]|uniref:Divergent polysaccharide deacetylase n=1 Tax=Wenxinia marina DSM 24838 TaxID=1123501 RepID=A0A0D0Q970_9RHOB|nr:divergent polysaccharide deacteylase family protein [Wenxinia marina]KIQ68922.1 hypothetical protein Wenmar_02654 [Wenxinia marina DSM 24838]GGL64147.1 hypothetical protein GCM10011392_18480 [Wenxinia marina]
MVRGVISGAFFGAVVSALALATASLMGDQPAGSAPPLTPGGAPPEDVAALPEVPEEPDSAPVQPQMPQIGAPTTAPGQVVPGDAEDAPPAETESEGAPPAADSAETLAAPEAGSAPELAAGSDTPVLPNPQAPPPEQPAGESDIVLSTEPATPQPPQPIEIVEAPAAEEPEATDVAPEVPQDVAEAPDAPVEPEVEETAGAGDGLAGEEGPGDEDVADAGADAPEVTQAATEDADPGEVLESTGSDTAEAAPGEQAADADDAPVVVDVPVVVVEEPEGGDEDTLALQGQDSGLPGGTADVVVRRPETGAADAPNGEAPAAEVDPDAPPLVRYAAPFENPQGQPLMSVVLIDDGSLPGAPAAVAGIPFPVTVAIDPAREDALEVMAAYRDRGIEVAVLPQLPPGAGASDVEVTLEAALAAVPEAVALIDRTGAWQSGGGIADQTLARLAGEGRGFVTISSGLNAGLRAAEAEGVPAEVVYRDLDSEGQDARVIRRFIDQAAFRARQESGVVLLARTRPDTISALNLWGSANRAGQVAQAPLSAVLLAQE